MTTLTLALVLLAVSVAGNVAQYVAGMRERRWWANRVIARHAPDVATLERNGRRRPATAAREPVPVQRPD